MADSTITGLSTGTALTGTELVPIVQGGNTKKITTQDIADLSGGGGAVDSVNGAVGVVVLDSDNIAEGVTNEYYTEAKVTANTEVIANTAKVSNVQADWNATSGLSEILNKPTITLFTIDLIDVSTVTFYAPYDMEIDSYSDIFNISPATVTILSNGAPYTLSTLITAGRAINITVSVAAVVNLNTYES